MEEKISKAHNWAVTRTFFAVLSDILLLASVFENSLKGLWIRVILIRITPNISQQRT